MNIANLDWSLAVDCPNCEVNIDLVKYDSNNDYLIANRIFKNEWDKLAGYEITCPHCAHEFKLDNVEY